MSSCSDCVNWSSFGCSEFAADTGEVVHFSDKAEWNCSTFKKEE